MIKLRSVALAWGNRFSTLIIKGDCCDFSCALWLNGCLFARGGRLHNNRGK
jgi:hypothetical protein